MAGAWTNSVSPIVNTTTIPHIWAYYNVFSNLHDVLIVWVAHCQVLAYVALRVIPRPRSNHQSSDIGAMVY